MTHRTADDIAELYKGAGDVVTLINSTKPSYLSDAAWKDMIKRNWRHLEIIKAYKQDDDTTSIWTTEDFTAIDAAIITCKGIQA